MYGIIDASSSYRYTIPPDLDIKVIINNKIINIMFSQSYTRNDV